MALWPIDPDIRRIATRFAGSSSTFPRLLAAVEQAEGNLVKAVRCTEKGVTTREQALDITARSAVHRMSDFIFADPARRALFVEFMAAEWAPRGVENDPTDLNKNWPINVKKLWT